MDTDMILFSVNAASTIKRMFLDRGYTDIKEKSVPKDDENSYKVIQGKDSSNKRVCYFVDVCDKLNNEKIRVYRALLDALKAKHCIISYDKKTPAVEQTIRALEESDDVKFELFQIKNLQYVIVDHYLQPKYFKLVSKGDLGRIKPNNLPIMLRSDPIVKYFNFESGNIIEMEKKDGNIVYRLVR